MESNPPDSAGSPRLLTDGGTTYERASDNAVIVPPGGDVGAAVQRVGDQEAEGRFGPGAPMDVVRLSAGGSYEIDEPIVIPPGVRLEWNGAVVRITADVDGFRFGGNTCLHEPAIHVAVEPYTSTILTATDAIEGGVRPHPSYTCRIRDMHVTAPYGQGTGLLIEDAEATGIWGVDATGVIWGTEVNLHLRSPVADSWVNSCSFSGVLGKSRVGILTEAHTDTKGMSGHRFDVIYQPEPDLSEWFWDLQNGSINRALANVWDKWAITDETVWRIGPDAGDHNAYVDGFNGAHRWEDHVENHLSDRNDNVLFSFAVAAGGEFR